MASPTYPAAGEIPEEYEETADLLILEEVEDSVRLRMPSDMSVERPATLELVSGDDEEDGDLSLEPHLVDFGELARGGMGSIRKVFDRNVLRYQAMKVADPMLAESPAAMLRFLEEAQITGQLEHPNVLPVYGVAMNPDGTPRYFTMKLARGETLQQVIDKVDVSQRNGRELERLLRILVKICEAMSFAHSRGVIHRDLKPDNVMVGTHGQVYVMDWGCAQLLGCERPSSSSGRDHVASSRREADEAGTIIGTVVYMAPEQAKGDIHSIDPRTDIYALGGMLYRILTDIPPHRSTGAREALRQAQSGVVTPPQERIPGVRLPPELCRIAMKAMAPEKADRYQRAEDFAADIERFLRGGAWFETRTYAANDLVIREGDEAEEAFIILRGKASAFKIENGERVVLRTMTQGEVFGESAILTGQVRTASVVASADEADESDKANELEVMVVTRDSLNQELALDSWAGALVRTLATRFRDLDGQLTDLRANPPKPIRAWIDAHLLYEGSPTASGGVVTSLSSLVEKLGAAIDVSEGEILAVVADAPDLAIDRARDTLTRER